jgi:hypothetical protein
MFGRLPNDPFITEMDPVLKMWYYENWIGDHRDQAELTKNHAYLLGSFWNPKAVQELMNPNVHESSDEDFEESSRMVKEANLDIPESPTKKKKKRKPKLVKTK